MLGTLFLIFTALVLGALAYAAILPDTYRVERSRQIAAPAKTLYENIVDLKRWEDWSPWEKMDPKMKHKYSGEDRGVGAVHEWNGNNRVGSGRMEITEAQANKRVAMNIDFRRPYSPKNEAELTLEPEDGGTRVTWSIAGPNPYLRRAMGLVMSVDGMVGQQFDRGLKNLEKLVESDKPAQGGVSGETQPA